MSRKNPDQVLRAMLNGWTLKVHRDLDGNKIYKLHPLDGQPEVIDRSTVDWLKEQGLIDSNKKFPVATYWLTDKGRKWGTGIRNQHF